MGRGRKGSKEVCEGGEGRGRRGGGTMEDGRPEGETGK